MDYLDSLSAAARFIRPTDMEFNEGLAQGLRGTLPEGLTLELIPDTEFPMSADGVGGYHLDRPDVYWLAVISAEGHVVAASRNLTPAEEAERKKYLSADPSALPEKVGA